MAMKTSTAGSLTSRSTLSGFRWADATCTSHGTPNSVRRVRTFSATSRSDLLPTRTVTFTTSPSYGETNSLAGWGGRGGAPPSGGKVPGVARRPTRRGPRARRPGVAPDPPRDGRRRPGVLSDPHELLPDRAEGVHSPRRARAGLRARGAAAPDRSPASDHPTLRGGESDRQLRDLRHGDRPRDPRVPDPDRVRGRTRDRARGPPGGGDAPEPPLPRLGPRCSVRGLLGPRVHRTRRDGPLARGAVDRSRRPRRSDRRCRGASESLVVR